MPVSNRTWRRPPGRHRAARPAPRRLRAALIAAAVTANAVIAPTLLSPPAMSQATTTDPGTLAAHPEWRLPETDPTAGALVADFTATLDRFHVAYDPSKIAVYRVPTVWGFRTYASADPSMFKVRPNTLLEERSASGTRTATPAEVLRRLLDPQASTQPAGGGVGIPSVYLHTSLINDVWDTVENPPNVPSIRYISAMIDAIVDEAVGDPNQALAELTAVLNAAAIEAQALAAETLQDVLDVLAGLPTTDSLVQAVLATADPAVQDLAALSAAVVAAIEALDVFGQVQSLLDSVPTDPSIVLGQIAALVDSLTEPLPPIDPLILAADVQRIVTEQVDALLAQAGLPPTSELDLTAVVVEVVDSGLAMALPDEWTATEVDARYAQYRERINALLEADVSTAGVDETLAETMGIINLNVDEASDTASDAFATTATSGGNVTMYTPRFSYDMQLRHYVASASWAWKICTEYNRPCWTYDKKSAGNVGGPDAFGLRITRRADRVNSGISMSDNCGAPAGGSDQPASDRDYGVGYVEPDKVTLAQTMCKGTPYRYNWHRGTISETFDFLVACAGLKVKVDSKMAHTWSTTGVDGIGVYANGIYLTWTSQGHQWTALPATPAYGYC